MTIKQPKTERLCILCGGLLKVRTMPDRFGRLICTRPDCKPIRNTHPKESS